MPKDRSTTRRILIRRLLAERRICSQGELATLLEEAGHRVTQATVSRDFGELGAAKVVDESGRERYSILAPRHRDASRFDHLRQVLANYLEDSIPSGNLVVLKVRVATAGAVADAIDAQAPPGVIGTIAGDDTVLVIAEESVGGRRVAHEISKILEA
jgi:transcriptional regulator of arginine metabolism